MVTTGFTAAPRAASQRMIAIGDIHGCAHALRELIARIRPTASDTLVMLGDYIDRGPDTRGVLDILVQLRAKCRVVPLLGNHEQMLFSARASHPMADQWLKFGGAETLDSYGPAGIEGIPTSHWCFLESCRLSFETATHFFVHANYDAGRPIAEQSEDTALSLSLSESIPPAHVSGKTAIVGHSAQPSGKILDLGYLKCIDTDCCNGGLLTALEVASGQVWQVREPRWLKSRGTTLGYRPRSLSDAFQGIVAPQGRMRTVNDPNTGSTSHG